MKKLLIMIASLSLFIGVGITETTHAFPSFYESDFSEGIPDDWNVENEGNITSDGSSTTIYTNGSGEEFDLYSDIELPGGYYEIIINGWYGNNTYGSDNQMKYKIGYESFTEVDTAELAYEHESFTYLMGQSTDENMESIELSYDGGYNTSVNEGDYMRIESVKINKIENVASYDLLQDFEGGIDTTIKSIDNPPQMSEQRLSNATIYGVDEHERGDVKLVERGSAVNDETYTHDDESYTATWSDQGGEVVLSFDNYYDTEQGDVVLNDMDNYPYDAIIILHDDSIGDEDDYTYSLEDYYLFEYDISRDDIINEDVLRPHLGNTDNMSMNRLSQANILLNDTEIIKDGAVTENEVIDHTFDEYGISEYQQIISEDKSDAASMTIAGRDHLDLLDKGDLKVFDMEPPDSGEKHTLQIYLPKEVRDVDTPGYDEPDDESNPNAPGGFQDLLTFYGLWNTAGILFLFAVAIVLTNIGLSILGSDGLAVFVADIVILSLFLYMGLMPIWVAAVLIPIFIAIFILTIKGGGINE